MLSLCMLGRGLRIIVEVSILMLRIDASVSCEGRLTMEVLFATEHFFFDAYDCVVEFISAFNRPSNLSHASVITAFV